MPTRLKLKEKAADGALPIEAPGLSPDRMAGLTRRSIEDLALQVGNRRERLGDLFDVEGDGTDDIEVEGDLSRFALVGDGMTRGRLTVRGPVGPRAGSRMSGGILSIEGSVRDYAGEGMSGGLLKILGDAGDHLAAPLPGRPRGMNGGAILLRGNAGKMAGMLMRRGTIVIAGDAGAVAGCSMLAGSLFVLGRLGAGAGALMRRGTIVAMNRGPLLPIFLDAGVSRQPFLRFYLGTIEAAGIPLPRGARGGLYRRYVGDISGMGKGEILMLEETSC
jgi:formylmethanofuran dehydrogenase subunit C